MSSYVTSTYLTSSVPLASTSHDKQHQHVMFVAGKVQLNKSTPINPPVSSIQHTTDSPALQSRKRPHLQEAERLCSATSVTNKSGQRNIYVNAPAKRVCRVNVAAIAVDNQSLNGQKLTSESGSTASVPLISVQADLSSLVRKASPAFVPSAAVPVVFVPVQLLRQQQKQPQPKPQQQQQRKKVLSPSLPKQQHSQQPVRGPTTASQLQQEIDALKQKRKALLQKLSLFHQLFRNKQRLASVARRLGIKIE